MPKKKKEKAPKNESADGTKRKIQKDRIKKMRGLVYFGKGKPYFSEIQEKERG